MEQSWVPEWGVGIPETIEAALESGYKPPCYRNPLLSSAMNKTGRITNERNTSAAEWRIAD